MDVKPEILRIPAFMAELSSFSYMLFGDGNRIAEVLLKRNGTAFHF